MSRRDIGGRRWSIPQHWDTLGAENTPDEVLGRWRLFSPCDQNGRVVAPQPVEREAHLVENCQ